MLREALELHQAGLCVVPLLERSKRPALASWKPYQRRRPESEELVRWFARGDRNLAVVCGQVSGRPGQSLAVLDFDRPGFETWAAEHAEIVEDTWLSASGREGGRHVWLLVPGGTPGATFGYGEVKAEGGYIVAPPSQHPGGRRYRWLQRGGRIAAVGDLSILGLETARAQIGYRTQWQAPNAFCAANQRKQRGGLRVSATPERLLIMALQRVAYGTRNSMGFWLAVQLRDNGYDRAAATNVMLRYQAAVAGWGEHAYTVAEALRTLRSAFSRPAREPWAEGSPG